MRGGGEEMDQALGSGLIFGMGFEQDRDGLEGG